MAILSGQLSVVSGQSSVVSCGWASVGSLVRASGGAAYGFEVAVQLRPQLVHPRLKGLHIFALEKSATVSSSQKMLRFVQRPTGGANKTPVISITTPPLPLGNVSP